MVAINGSNPPVKADIDFGSQHGGPSSPPDVTAPDQAVRAVPPAASVSPADSQISSSVTVNLPISKATPGAAGALEPNTASIATVQVAALPIARTTSGSLSPVGPAKDANAPASIPSPQDASLPIPPTTSGAVGPFTAVARRSSSAGSTQTASNSNVTAGGGRFAPATDVPPAASPLGTGTDWAGAAFLSVAKFMPFGAVKNSDLGAALRQYQEGQNSEEKSQLIDLNQKRAALIAAQAAAVKSAAEQLAHKDDSLLGGLGILGKIAISVVNAPVGITAVALDKSGMSRDDLCKVAIAVGGVLAVTGVGGIVGGILIGLAVLAALNTASEMKYGEGVIAKSVETFGGSKSAAESADKYGMIAVAVGQIATSLASGNAAGTADALKKAGLVATVVGKAGSTAEDYDASRHQAKAEQYKAEGAVYGATADQLNEVAQQKVKSISNALDMIGDIMDGLSQTEQKKAEAIIGMRFA